MCFLLRTAHNGGLLTKVRPTDPLKQIETASNDFFPGAVKK